MHHSGAIDHLHVTSCFSFFNLQGGTSSMKAGMTRPRSLTKVIQQNKMKSFGEKLIEVANVSYLS